jgi:ATP-dependent RNA helicase DHX8/PRP22
LTGQEDIEDLVNLLQDKQALIPRDMDTLTVLPLYSALPSQFQLLAFQKAPAKTRKVVLATNIAETSVTIEGIKYVVDCGLSKVHYSPSKGIKLRRPGFTTRIRISKVC